MNWLKRKISQVAELWYAITKGRYFVCKELIDDNGTYAPNGAVCKRTLSTWYLSPVVNNWSNRSFQWDITPKTWWGIIAGYLIVKAYRKREKMNNIRYYLIQVEDYAFIENVMNGEK